MRKDLSICVDSERAGVYGRRLPQPWGVRQGLLSSQRHLGGHSEAAAVRRSPVSTTQRPALLHHDH
jgi:hypothetical protein